jgi:hypothetical protein
MNGFRKMRRGEMNNTNLEKESAWVHRLSVKTRNYINEPTALWIVLYSCITVYGNWIL